MATHTHNLNLTLPAGAEQVSRQILNDDFTAIDTAVGTSASDKADKVSGATNGNFAGLDSSGNLTDSGKNANSFPPYDIVTDEYDSSMAYPKGFLCHETYCGGSKMRQATCSG
jgi:hypothetical protein